MMERQGETSYGEHAVTLSVEVDTGTYRRYDADDLGEEIARYAEEEYGDRFDVERRDSTGSWLSEICGLLSSPSEGRSFVLEPSDPASAQRPGYRFVGRTDDGSFDLSLFYDEGASGMEDAEAVLEQFERYIRDRDAERAEELWGEAAHVVYCRDPEAGPFSLEYRDQP